MELKGKVMQIQNFSVNDGDGIRSTVFLAGCPLKCMWCANPEGMTPENKIAWQQKTCIGCGKCAEVCPQNIGINLNLPESREKCTGCGKCTEVCPNGSRKNMVTVMTSDEIISELKPYFGFFRQSKGGVTFSGGDPLLQKDFLFETASKLYDSGINIALETELYLEFESVRHILELFDTVFVDIKLMDCERHLYYTGVGNERILENIKKLGWLDKDVIIRIPVIEGVNADNKNIVNTAEFVNKYMPKAKIELLEYHRYGESKYEALGIKCPPKSFCTPKRDRIFELKRLIEKTGVETIEYK
ncbi:glycyl-radical enzyme activating protein [Lachnospiraceae bacterium NSJ-143]|nr:glycyl-radical enzyme activating protein [Lachnospiraceae bacterium NSJ-143]